MNQAATQREFIEQRRSNDAALAVSLDEWKRFSILKFDEGNERMAAIEIHAKKNTELTEALGTRLATMEKGIGDVLIVVTALAGTKQTIGWIGSGVLWLGKSTLLVSALIGVLAGAFIAVKVAIAQALKSAGM